MKNLLGLILAIGATVLRYFVILKLYTYFLVPLGLPALSIPTIIGLMMLLYYITHEYDYRKDQQEKEARATQGIDSTQALFMTASGSIGGSLGVWGVAAIIAHFFL